jgi:D-amino-acid dehydrogenase
MSLRVVIVGGGIAGLSTAWFLTRGGAEVTVLEARTVGSGSSFANGGWLCPAQAGPLAEPGLTLFAMRSFLERSSPLYISPRYLPHALGWFLQFRRYCTTAAFQHGMSAIARLGLDTFKLVEAWRAAGVEFEIHKQGMIYAARDEASAA